MTVASVLALVLAAGLTLFGLGAFDRAIAVYDPTAWLFSGQKGELGRVNGGTAKVDTRVKVDGTQSHRVEVSQTDRYLVIRDVDSGKVSALDLATLQISASMDTTPGLGVRVVLHGKTAYIVDSVHGEVRPVDALTLNASGAPMRFAPGLRGGDFDADGKLWLALPSQGTVVSIAPGTGKTPVVQTQALAGPSHDLELTVLDKGAAVLDETAAQLVLIRGEKITRTAVKLGGPGALPGRTSGDAVPVTVPAERRVYVVKSDPKAADPKGAVTNFPVPGSGATLDAAVAWAGWFYVADDAAGVVYVLDGTGALVDQIRFPDNHGSLDLEVRESYLYINGVDSDTARVVDDQHKVSVVNKYPNDVPGGDPPPPTPPPPPAPPLVGPPGPPGAITATAGNATVKLTWGAATDNGSPLLRYVVQGDGRSFEVGAGQRRLVVPGLTNGKSYTFSVRAVNGLGTGPPRNSSPVVPTSDVPDPPGVPVAHEQPDGTVAVTWPAANGQGHKISRYDVTAVGPGVQKSVGVANGAAFTVPAGALDYGTQFAFMVTSVNDKGADSQPSAVSNAVVPYTKPSAPKSLGVTTGNAKGTVHVAWAPAVSNGRPITKYVVTANGHSFDATGSSYDVKGMPDGQKVSVSVAAVNAAGPGAAAGPKAAETIAVPVVQLGSVSQSHNWITVQFAVTKGGGQLNCTLQFAGAGSASGNCGTLTVGGLAPGVNYNFTVRVTNPAGAGTAQGSHGTDALFGTVTCVVPSYCNDGVWSYTAPWQQTPGYADAAHFNGNRLQAFCKIMGKKGNQQPEVTLHAVQYNHQKASPWWIRYTASGNHYIPFIWLNLDDGDDLNLLPNC